MVKFVKVLKHIICKLGIDITPFLLKSIAVQLKGYDVVIGYQEGVATQLASYIDAPKKIAWIHCMYSEHIKNVKNVKKEECLYKKFNDIVCVSKTAQKEMNALFPDIAKKTLVVYNAIDIDRINQLSNNELHISLSNSINIVSIGRICKVKRFSEIPKIVSSLISMGVDIHWYVVGGNADDEEYSNLHNNISKYNVQNYITCTGPLDNPYPLLRSSSILVCLSSSETFNYTIAEAKSLLIPVVSTDFSSAYEFIDNGKTGFITKLDNISNVIFSLINNNLLYNSIIENLSNLRNTNDYVSNQLEKLLL